MVVTGISQSGDVSALEGLLKGASLPLDRFEVVGPEDSDREITDPEEPDAGTARVIAVGGPDIIKGDGGTVVPGLTNYEPSAPRFRWGAVAERLGELDIPESEIDNYVEALDAGRSVVVYIAEPETRAGVEEIFRSAGLAKVKTF